MNLSDFLRVFDFSYDITKSNEIRLIDLEGVNLGQIEEERFPINEDGVKAIIDRLDSYINEYVVMDLEIELDEKGIDYSSMNLAEKIKKVKELGIEEVYDIIDAIIYPETIEIDKFLEQDTISYDEKSKTWDYKWIEFLSGVNVLEVKNVIEFTEFKEFLEEHGLIGILKNILAFEDWQQLAKINNWNPKLFYFEYNNSKGLTWYDNKEKPMDWYGKEPITTKELLEKEVIEKDKSEKDKHQELNEINNENIDI